MMKTVSVMFFLSIVQQCNIGFVCTTQGRKLGPSERLGRVTFPFGQGKT